MTQKFYVVWLGRQPGIYTSWEECAEQVKGFAGAKYKAFTTEARAEEAFELGWQRVLNSTTSFQLPAEVIADSLSVDAACEGNPGRLEYRGVHTQSGREIFHRGPFGLGTNNIGEFLAIVEALVLLQEKGQTKPIYSDSKIARKWVKQKEVLTQLPRNEQTEAVWLLVDWAIKWLQNHTYPNPVLEWDTEKWGEIRADFGRK